MISFVTMAVKISQGCMNWFGNEAMIVSFILYRMYGVRAPYGAGFVRRLAHSLRQSYKIHHSYRKGANTRTLRARVSCQEWCSM